VVVDIVSTGAGVMAGSMLGRHHTQVCCHGKTVPS
jgi:hypothetical protein